jgi:hypothetical protein
MTDKQRILYFRAWNAARCAFSLEPSAFVGEVAHLRARILAIAQERAQDRQTQDPRLKTQDSLRHGCHLVALGKNKSSKSLTNPELDRLLALFRLLADPEDLGAMLAWNNPSEEARKRILYSINTHFVESYAAQVSREKFGTPDFETLPTPDLRQLHMTLKNRPNSRIAAFTPLQCTQPENEPF